MTLGSFTAKDRTKNSSDKNIYFGNQSKHLSISSALGLIEYHDSSAQASFTSSIKGIPEPVKGVPNETEATQLGLKYLRLLGINRDEIATKSGSSELDLHWDKGTRSYMKNKQEVDEILNYGVFFLRRIDGINVRGIGYGGGLFVSFGNNRKVIDLRLSWRNLRPFEFNRCPPPEQIVKWINDGQIVLRLHGSKKAYPLSEINKLTMTVATLRYEGAYYDEPMDFVFPYLDGEGIAENEHATNNVWFQSPMTFSRANWRIITEN